MRSLRSFFIALCAILGGWRSSCPAQSIDTVLLTEIGRYQHGYVAFPDSFSAPTLSSRIDRLGRPYLYMACNDSGLITLDISVPSAPLVVDRKHPSAFGGLNVSNVEQIDDLLFVALGRFEGTSQNTGFAILDITDPTAPMVLDFWNGGASFPNGCANVKVDGAHAYLAAMESGIVVLDVSDPSDIQFTSTYQPDPTWPGIASYAPNGRGIAIAGNILYLAYDAGGFRTIDISDPASLSQIGQYLNPDIPAFTPPACNNVVVIGDRAYCTIDFCGLEVVDITDPAAMTQVNWLNPWNCTGLSWFGSDGHTNELMSALGDSLLFVSGADSEVLVYDITDADAPVLKGGHILPNDSAATWGVDVFGDHVVANFVNTHGLPLQPYDSKYGGVVLFQWMADSYTSIDEDGTAHFDLFPDPTDGLVSVRWEQGHAPVDIRITDPIGRVVLLRTFPSNTATLDLSEASEGLYIVELFSRGTRTNAQRLMVR